MPYNLTLVRVTENTLVLCRGFERKESYVRHGDRFLLAQIELRNGAGVMLHHEYRHADQPVLSDLITYQGDLTNVHLHLGTMIDDHGHLKGLWEIRAGARPVDAGCQTGDQHPALDRRRGGKLV